MLAPEFAARNMPPGFLERGVKGSVPGGLQKDVLVDPDCAGCGYVYNQTHHSRSGVHSESGSSINIDLGKLQHEFKHASDFGITGKWNKYNASAYHNAIESHVNGKNTQVIAGTYRGTISVTHYFDPTTRLDVMVDGNGNYVAGWRLSADQIKYLTANGNVQ
jgi:hypothetical protein